ASGVCCSSALALSGSSPWAVTLELPGGPSSSSCEGVRTVPSEGSEEARTGGSQLPTAVEIRLATNTTPVVIIRHIARVMHVATIWPLRLRPVTDPLSPMFAFRRKLCTPRKNGAGTRGTIPALGKVLPVRVDHDLDPLEFLAFGVTGSGHGTAQRTHEVHGAVTGVGGAVQDGPQVTDRADLHPLTTRQLVVVRLAAPVVTTPGCLFGAGQGRADHHGIGPACQGFGDVPTAGHAAVGDDVYVTATGLVEVVAAGSGHITDGAGHRHGHTQYGACGVARTTTETDQDTRGASTHQVQGGGVGGATADHHRHIEVVDELLEVERFGTAGDVFGRDRGAPDHEDVHTGVDDRPV